MLRDRSGLVSLSLVLALASSGCPDNPPTPPIVDAGPAADAGALTDDLSMPAVPTVALENFIPSRACGACHTSHYLEWKGSMHAYAMIDPVYRALVGLRQAEFGGMQDRFCLQCHTPIGTRSGDIQPGFSFGALAEVTLEGVNCETCHRVSAVQRTYNSGLVIDDQGPVHGPIQSPEQSGFHASEYSAIFDDAAFCGACHDVIEVNGLNLERPFAEWLESPAADTGETCQDCHMPTYEGQATDIAPVRPNLHEHHFVGVDMPLTDDFITDPVELDAHRTRVAQLLGGAATLTLSGAGDVRAGTQFDLFIHIRNNINAHNLPTGSTFARQVWLEVTATGAGGEILYQTGDLDMNGDLRDHFSELDPYGDRDLITLGSRLVNKDGSPELFTWRATEHFTNSLSPLYDRTYTLFIPTRTDTTGPVHISARLRFRSFAPYLLRVLGLADLLPKLEIFEIDTAVLDVPVVAP